ncbi:MAG: hypothetical protein ACOZQL_19930 [Myxococcota bacterium]
MARRWWVLILLGVVPGVVLVLWSGTPRSVDESAAGSIEASPPVVPVQAKASRAEVRRPSEAAVAPPASQNLQVPVVHDLQPQFRLPPGTQLKTGTRETPCRGTRFKAANTDPGRRYRLKWDLDFHIGMPEKQPELPPEELQSINP